MYTNYGTLAKYLRVTGTFIKTRVYDSVDILTRTKAAGLDQVARANCNQRPAILS